MKASKCLGHIRARSVLFLVTRGLTAAVFLLACRGGSGDDYFRPQLVLDAKGLLGNAITSVDISNDGNWLAASAGKEVLIWDRSKKQHFATLRGYQEPGGFRVGTVNRVKFMPDNRHLAVAVSDNTDFGSTRLYDLSDPYAIKQLLKGHAGCTKQLAVSPSGKYMVTSGCDGMLYISGLSAEKGVWNPVMRFHNYGRTGGRQTVQTTPYNVPTPEFNYQVHSFPWNDAWFLSGYTDSGSLLSLEARAFVEFRNWPQPLKDLVALPGRVQPPVPGKTTFGVVDLAYDEATWALISGFSVGADSTTYWAAAWRDGQLARTYPLHRERPTAVALNLEARLAVSGDAFGEVHVWGLDDSPGPPEIYGIGNQRIFRVAWSEDGKRLQYADTFYPFGEYNFNRLGPITKEFPLLDRGIRSLATESVEDEQQDRTRVDLAGAAAGIVGVRSRRGDGTQWELVSIDEADRTRPLQPHSIPRFAAYDLPPAQLVGSNFGDVWSYCEVPRAHRISPDPELLVGTDKGELIQVSISQLPRKAAPCLVIRRRFVGHSARITSLDVSPDERYLASSSWDGTIRVWDLAHHQPVPDVDFHTSGSSVVHVPKGSNAERAGLREGDAIVELNGYSYYARHRRAMEGEFRAGDVVTIKYRRSLDERQCRLKLVPGVEYLEPALSIFLAHDGEWVAWTPRGYYDSSGGGERYIGWHVNRARYEPALFHEVGQYRAELYRPDVINAALRGELAAVAERQQLPLAPANLADMEQIEEIVEAEPPSISILSPANNASVAEEEIELVINVSHRQGEGQEVKTLLVQVNGSTPAAMPQRAESLVEGDTQNDVFKVRIQLTDSTNVISVRATNYQDVASSLRQITVHRKAAVPVDSNAPDLYILAVGISAYSDPLWRLQYAAKDAEDFASAFQQQNRFYRRVECEVLTDAEATVAGIKKGMTWLQRSVQRPSDYAFVFLAGHGVFNVSDTWYFGSVDLDPADLRNTGISQVEIQQFMERELGGRAILFADTCHAASAVSKRGMPVRATHSQGINPWRTLEKLALLSCLPHQESCEGQRWQNGVFTHCLVQSLESPTCDVDQDGYISFDELALIVKTRVLRETAQQQEPSEVKNVPTGLVRLGTARSP